MQIVWGIQKRPLILSEMVTSRVVGQNVYVHKN